jgi:ubiquinol-cytochrome c reductase cytochrome b subunit
LIPFVLLGLVIIHITLLHEKGSRNPVGLSFKIDKIPFHPFFSIKDLFGFLILITFFIFICLVSPFVFADPENFIQANPIVTPVHIQPE